MRSADIGPGGRGEILALAPVDRTHANQDRVPGGGADERAQPVLAVARPEGVGVDEIGHDGAARPEADAEPTPAREGVGRDGEHASMEPGVDLGVVGVQVREAGHAVEQLEAGAEVAGAGEVRMEDADGFRAAEVGDPTQLAERPAREIGRE